ncbi:hypothetical protein FOCC_FOCC013423 [Frankliniella occidentalis]|nr:hypothetical protein FOCC_FOCC013423 [Frankliniella occidentalis]
MKRLFKRPDFVQNIRYNQTRQKENSDNIEDIYDGEIYKRAQSQGFTNNGITFMFNTDGIPVFKSNSYSLWPFYLVILELPPEKRFLSENLIIAGIWGSTVKPHPNVFLVPIYKQLLILKGGIDVEPYGESETQKVTGTLVCGTCDAPATAAFINMKIHSGFYSCPVCMTKGVHPGDSTVFPFEENVPLRDMQSYKIHVQQAVKDKIIFLKTVKHEELYCGIKGPTVLSDIFSNIFDSMAIDGMHCLCLGVMKQLLKLWFIDGKYSEKAKLLSEKLLDITPPEYLQRKPQPVEKLIHWKASELRSFLYNLSVLLLEDILESDDFQHFCLFVKGVSLLNSQSISQNDVILADRLLKQFVQDFKIIYGIDNVSHNVHMCLHLPHCVQLLGPLWSFSCFMFEDINGRLLNLIHGTRHVGLQIHSNISVITHLPLMIFNLKEGPVKQYCTNIKKYHRLKITEPIGPRTYCVGKFTEIGVDTAWVIGVLRRENVLNPSSEVLLIHRILHQGLLYYASLYKCNRVSSYIKYRDTSVKYGSIVCFVKVICMCSLLCSCESQYFAIVKPFHVSPFEVNNIVLSNIMKCNTASQVDLFCQCDVIPIADILCVLFKVERAGDTFLVEPLNKHELE